MRRSLLLLALLLAAAVVPAAAVAAQDDGFVVYKDYRGYGVTELRDASTGRIVSSEVEIADASLPGLPCLDSRHKFTGAYWRSFEPYLVNLDSRPSYLDGGELLADLQAAHAAWEGTFVTDCPNVPGYSDYQAIYGGLTDAPGSLGQLVTDGLNVVAFQPLAGTLCAGALACVITEFQGSQLHEADLLIESDLEAYGFNEVWSTGDTTDPPGVSPRRFAISDVTTHEWGHFAGLGHVLNSPSLTMFPYIQDGTQTLGLGDMKGILARY